MNVVQIHIGHGGFFFRQRLKIVRLKLTFFDDDDLTFDFFLISFISFLKRKVTSTIK